MKLKKLNKNLRVAKHNKNDEFYTQLADIEKELKYYKSHFKNKTIFCNCDDSRVSNFVKHFKDNFKEFGLKDLLFSNGLDFRSEKCIKLLKQSDIVVTNPPFSLFREYIAQLTGYNKKFLIIGSLNAITYKEIFPLIRDNKIWLGINPVKEFLTPGGQIQKFGNILWYTNLLHKKRNEKLILISKYGGNEKNYPKYDNYNAIEVNKVKNIPKDYTEIMGVPITFLNKYNPEQFEILGNEYDLNIPKGRGYVKGKRMYSRIFIKSK